MAADDVYERLADLFAQLPGEHDRAGCIASMREIANSTAWVIHGTPDARRMFPGWMGVSGHAHGIVKGIAEDTSEQFAAQLQVLLSRAIQQRMDEIEAD